MKVLTLLDNAAFKLEIVEEGEVIGIHLQNKQVEEEFHGFLSFADLKTIRQKLGVYIRGKEQVATEEVYFFLKQGETILQEATYTLPVNFTDEEIIQEFKTWLSVQKIPTPQEIFKYDEIRLKYGWRKVK